MVHASGTAELSGGSRCAPNADGGSSMNAIIYLVGLVVIVLAVLSLIGLR